MLLLWLTCQLTIAAAMSTLHSPMFEHVWRIINTMNDTEARLDRNYYRNQEQKICETKHCYEIARKIMQNRDMDADPCEDFYQYACGSWSKHNPIPDNAVEWSESHIVANKTDSRIREILEEPNSPNDILPIRMARKLYRSCMDTDAIEKRGIRPIQEILDRHGGWPMAMAYNEWDHDRFSWQQIDKHYVRLIGNSAFYNLEYEIDFNNTKRYVLTLDQDTVYPSSSKMNLNNIFYKSNLHAIGIFRVAQAFAREKGYTLDRHQLAVDVADLIYFERDLLQIIETDKQIHTLSNNFERMTIKRLQQWYDNSNVTSPTAKIDFLEVIQHVFKLANMNINSTEPIVVYNPDFLHKLARLLADTSRRVLVNYVQWNMVNKFLKYTTQEMRDIMFDTSLSSYNVSNYTPRWQVCVANMEMRNAISYVFVKRYTSDHVIHQVIRMVRKIKDALMHRIGQAHWLPSTIRVALMQKLNTLDMQIGYPEWYKDADAVTRFYEGLEIGSDYFQNILNCQETKLKKVLVEFRNVVVRDRWSDYPITVNSFYIPIVNTIIIPAAEVQDPHFTPFVPDAVNYGAIGSVIGHEFSHGFDNEDIQFDKEGYKISWSSRHVLDEHENRSKCFVDQYGNYTLDITDEEGERVKLDGRLTVNENMADSIGIQLAYSAYKKATKQKIETRLPGLEYISNDELFFLSYASAWCSSTRPDYEADTFNDDVHSPAKYRIIGSLSNMAAFSKTFNCPQNSFMNRRQKCTLWN